MSGMTGFWPSAIKKNDVLHSRVSTLGTKLDFDLML